MILSSTQTAGNEFADNRGSMASLRAYWKRRDGLMGRTRTQGMDLLTCLLES